MDKALAHAALIALGWGFTTPGHAADVPEGTVAFFTEGRQCPTGWAEAQYAHGRLLLGGPEGATAPEEVGTAMIDQTPPLHAHRITAEAEVLNRGTAHLPNVNKGIGKAGIYQANPVDDHPPDSQPAETGYPFVQHLVCELTAPSSGDAFPQQSVSHFNRPSCPEGWIAEPNYLGRFLLPRTESLRIGLMTDDAWVDSANPPHLHAYNGSINVGSLGFVLGAGADYSTATQGEMAVTGQLLPNAEPMVPFVKLLACRKTQMTAAGQLPPNLSILYAGQNCPSRWTPVSGSAGRFLVGAAPSSHLGAAFGGNPMRADEFSRSHSHAVSLTFTVPDYPQDLSSSFENMWLGKAGVHTSSGTSSSTSMTLPYIVVSHCQAAPAQLP